jgi:ribose transport system ATP-binding protein
MTLSPTKSLLEIRNLHKALAGNKILNGINFDVRAGEIHALMGGNGAGKSTLIKCLSGYWTPDQGSIKVDGELLNATKKQIAFVQQDLGLIPALTVSENISLSLGFDVGRFFNIRWQRQHDKVAHVLSDLGYGDINPRSLVRDLNPAQRTVVAIARAAQGLREGAKVLVLDEPTASLPVNEVDRLFETLNRLRATGVGMIYVSHHLSEVFELSDRISVLRGGNLISTDATSATSEDRTVELMLGAPVNKVRRAIKTTAETQQGPILKLDGLHGRRVSYISLALYPGEIVGVAGLQGSGCTELASLIFGAIKPTSGSIQIDGEKVEFNHPQDAIKAGIAMVTEDRHLDGGLADHAVGENMTITDLARFAKVGVLSRKEERAEIQAMVEQFDVRPADGTRRFSSLSGGNQQKAILAKWLRLNPKILICDQPDIGVDIGAKNAIYAFLQKVASTGSAVILISNQFDDLEALCGRVLVMRAGQIVQELKGDNLTEHKISHAAIGSVKKEAVFG